MSWVQETMLGKLESINSIPAIFFRPNMYQGGSRTPESPKTELFEIYVTVFTVLVFTFCHKELHPRGTTSMQESIRSVKVVEQFSESKIETRSLEFRRRP